jgi:hypothetical protein
VDAAAMAHRAAAYRLGGGMVLLGTIAWIVLSGLHGELPGTGQEVISQAQAALWRPAHLFTIVAIVIVAAGLALLSGTLMDARAAVAGRAGAMIAVPAAAVMGVGFAIEGFVLPAIASAYATAPDEAARTMHLTQADLVLKVIGGTSFAYQTLFGLAIVMLAIATYLSREYPHWHCWLGMLGGAIWTTAGVLIFVGDPQAGFWLVSLPALPVAIWLLGFGGLAWQQATVPAPSVKPAT